MGSVLRYQQGVPVTSQKWKELGEITAESVRVETGTLNSLFSSPGHHRSHRHRSHSKSPERYGLTSVLTEIFIHKLKSQLQHNLINTIQEFSLMIGRSGLLPWKLLELSVYVWLFCFSCRIAALNKGMSLSLRRPGILSQLLRFLKYIYFWPHWAFFAAGPCLAMASESHSSAVVWASRCSDPPRL